MFNMSKRVESDASEREKRMLTTNTPVHSAERPTPTPVPG